MVLRRFFKVDSKFPPGKRSSFVLVHCTLAFAYDVTVDSCFTLYHSPSVVKSKPQTLLLGNQIAKFVISLLFERANLRGGKRSLWQYSNIIII